MEIKRDTDYFSIQPPRLEDAGLEEPGLPLEGIQEAFQRAAEVVKSRTVELMPNAFGQCCDDPGPTDGEQEDAVLDSSSTALEKSYGTCVNSVASEVEEQCGDVVIPMDPHIEDAIVEGKEVGEQQCVDSEKEC